MNCKECLHYDVCKDENGNTDYYGITYEELCSDFKDKSKFIELPCNVGDTLYVYEPGFDRVVKVEVSEITYKITYKGYLKTSGYVTVFAGYNKQDNLLGYHEYSFERFDTTIFTSRSSAEKVLKLSELKGSEKNEYKN